MSSQEKTPPPSGGDLPAVLGVLSSLAVTVLLEHTNEDGLCAVCRGTWPCQPVVLADHNLAAL
ncbi:MAG: hypothetical protein ACRDTG_16130 [Pseudonocardiaceae bacterium]